MNCVPEPNFGIGRAWVERNSIEERPVYQRASSIWSEDKQQLFIDSILNGYDLPKIYFHDLRGLGRKHRYALVDGKQRMQAIWDFMDDRFAMDVDFRLAATDADESLPGGKRFSELSNYWQERFKGITLPVILIQRASEDDIEELFSRLNNGEPLNAAEKRNAFGGTVAGLIRNAAEHPFFKKRVAFENRRYLHLELAARLLLIEKTEADGGEAFCDLKKRPLDRLVKENRNMPKQRAESLERRLKRGLDTFAGVFNDNDPLLRKNSTIVPYYLFYKLIEKEYAHSQLRSKVRRFLEAFQVTVEKNRERVEGADRDEFIEEYDRLSVQGTSNRVGIERRVHLLMRYFLEENPDLKVRDLKRAFSDDERHAIWVIGDKKCAQCGVALPFEDMEADHHEQWAHGGPTTLSNGRCLCKMCNAKKAERVH